MGYLEKKKSQEVIVSDEAEIVLRRESLEKEGRKEIIQKEDLNEGIQEKENSAEDATSTVNDKISQGSKNEENISDQAMLKKGNEDNITSLAKIDTNNKQEVILPHEMETGDNKEIEKQPNVIDKNIEVREDMKEERAESLTNDTVKEDIIKGVEALSNESLKETELVNKVELSKDVITEDIVAEAVTDKDCSLRIEKKDINISKTPQGDVNEAEKESLKEECENLKDVVQEVNIDSKDSTTNVARNIQQKDDLLEEIKEQDLNKEIDESQDKDAINNEKDRQIDSTVPKDKEIKGEKDDIQQTDMTSKVTQEKDENVLSLTTEHAEKNRIKRNKRYKY